jgi:phenylalanine-4-hydroxylase
MRTDYVIDDLQPTYFVIESFEDLVPPDRRARFRPALPRARAGFTYANSQ